MEIGQVFTWGFCTHGQLGLKEKILGSREYIEVPTQAGSGSDFGGVEVKAVACGHFHTLVADAKGNLFSFGRNDRGQLGRGDDCEDTSERPGAVPRRVKALSRSIISDVRCGAFHCLASTLDGALFSWGWNQHGQLGRRTPYRSCSEPGLVQFHEAKEAAVGALRSFSAGLMHSAAVFSSGQLYSWGGNDHGQLGLGRAVRHPEVAEIPHFVNGVVGRQVAAGDNQTLVVTVDCLVVACGNNEYGQLGRPKEAVGEADFGRFLVVEGLPLAEDLLGDNVSSVACGGATCAALTEKGELFTWGGGVWGQHGRGDQNDSYVPGRISGLPRVVAAHVAQDHILAQCAESQETPNKVALPEQTVQEPEVDPETGEAEDGEGQGPVAVSSLWAWGRRKLLPKEREPEFGSEHEAQCGPLRVPLRWFGIDESRLLESRLQLKAACGGAHSIVFLAQAFEKEQKQIFTAARCPRMSTVTGPGTKGGRVSEPLPFRITSRNEEGRDEKVGGLRFKVWAEYATTAARSPSRRSSGPISASPVFDLQFVNDCCDGTYDGCYTITSTGSYRLHVHLMPDQSQDTEEDAGNLRGEPVMGSPFPVIIDSGPAFAANCQVRLKRGGRTIQSGQGNAQSGDKEVTVFEVDACADVAWDVLSFDLLGNAGTLRSDRFVASIEVSEDAANSTAEEAVEQDLATSMGFPAVQDGASPASRALRERIRQRTAERVWLQVSSKSTAGADSSSSSSRPLQVRQGKENGKSEVRWTPGRIGSYRLCLGLLGPGRHSVSSLTDKGQNLAGSPFLVQVVAGRPVASQSQLLVGAAAESPWHTIPTSLASDTLKADIPVRLVLRDRAGNVSTEAVNPLKHVSVRVEAVAVVGDTSDDFYELLDWSVSRNGGTLLTISVTGTSQLLSVARRCQRKGKPAAVQFFVSAIENGSCERLSGSPWPVELVTPLESVDAYPEPNVETSQDSGMSSNVSLEQTVDKEPLAPEPELPASEEKRQDVRQPELPAKLEMPPSLTRSIVAGIFASAAKLPAPEPEETQPPGSQAEPAEAEDEASSGSPAAATPLEDASKEPQALQAEETSRSDEASPRTSAPPARNVEAPSEGEAAAAAAVVHELLQSQHGILDSSLPPVEEVNPQEQEQSWPPADQGVLQQALPVPLNAASAVSPRAAVLGDSSPQSKSQPLSPLRQPQALLNFDTESNSTDMPKMPLTPTAKELPGPSPAGTPRRTQEEERPTAWMTGLAAPKAAPKRRSSGAIATGAASATRRRGVGGGGAGLNRLRPESAVAAPSVWPKANQRET